MVQAPSSSAGERHHPTYVHLHNSFEKVKGAQHPEHNKKLTESYHNQSISNNRANDQAHSRNTETEPQKWNIQADYSIFRWTKGKTISERFKLQNPA